MKQLTNAVLWKPEQSETNERIMEEKNMKKWEKEKNRKWGKSTGIFFFKIVNKVK